MPTARRAVSSSFIRVRIFPIMTASELFKSPKPPVEMAEASAVVRGG